MAAAARVVLAGGQQGLCTQHLAGGQPNDCSMHATASAAAIAPVRTTALRPCSALLASPECCASSRTAHLRTCGPPTSTSQAVSARRRGISGSPHVAPEASRTWKRASSSGPKHSCRQWRHTRAQVAILLGRGGYRAKDGGPAVSQRRGAAGGAAAARGVGRLHPAPAHLSFTSNPSNTRMRAVCGKDCRPVLGGAMVPRAPHAG